MQACLIDANLLVPTSRSSAKVKVKYQGHISQKMAILGALVFHKHILLILDFSPGNQSITSKYWHLHFLPELFLHFNIQIRINYQVN